MTLMNDLHEEAQEIHRRIVELELLRKQHRQAVLDCMNEPDADIKTLVEILSLTEKGFEDGTS